MLISNMHATIQQPDQNAKFLAFWRNPHTTQRRNKGGGNREPNLKRNGYKSGCPKQKSAMQNTKNTTKTKSSQRGRGDCKDGDAGMLRHEQPFPAF